MISRKLTFRRGFTLMELAIAAVSSVIVMVGIAVVLVDGMKGWNRMYSRVYAEVVTDSHVARRMFDTEIRKASRERYSVATDGSSLEVYYYFSAASTEPDRYARFYTSSGDLNVEYGIVEPRETLRVQTVCGNVTSCTFMGQGCSAQMVLTLSDGSQTVTTVASAVMHNQ
ncbi:MAG TPA: hypothetical protein VMX13_00860 [Sedimentisphaerales bacterium]|nr:hypothetical protein [Sedimentisphaerales bacterium]